MRVFFAVDVAREVSYLCIYFFLSSGDLLTRAPASKGGGRDPMVGTGPLHFPNISSGRAQEAGTREKKGIKWGDAARMRGLGLPISL